MNIRVLGASLSMPASEGRFKSLSNPRVINCPGGSLGQIPGDSSFLTLGWSAALVGFALWSVGTASAQQVFDRDYYRQNDGPSIRGELGLYSDRLFRGQNLYNGVSVQPQARAGIDVGFGELYGAMFSHFSGDQNHGDSSEDRKSFSEFDLELGDKIAFDDLAFSGGYRWYNYSRTSDRLQDTGEFFGGLDTSIIAHPYFHLAYDTDKHKGYYYEMGLSEPIPFRESNQRDAVIPSVALGISSSLDDGAHPIYEDDGIAFIGFGMKGVLELDEVLSLQPEIRYNVKADDATTSDFSFGVNLVSELPGSNGSGSTGTGNAGTNVAGISRSYR